MLFVNNIRFVLVLGYLLWGGIGHADNLWLAPEETGEKLYYGRCFGQLNGDYSALQVAVSKELLEESAGEMAWSMGWQWRNFGAEAILLGWLESLEGGANEPSSHNFPTAFNEWEELLLPASWEEIAGDQVVSANLSIGDGIIIRSLSLTVDQDTGDLTAIFYNSHTYTCPLQLFQ